jgi:Fe-S oxidoreductase
MAQHSQQRTTPEPLRPQLLHQIAATSTNCVQCQVCVNECQFLQLHGDPKTLADNYIPTDKHCLQIPFECSLCELCTAVCPHGVEPPKLFLEMRRESFERGQNNLPQHRGLRNYEKKGTSKRFSWYALPEDCDTIFFPGCALAGSRSEITLKVFEQLQCSIPNIGIVLDCCTKPSHDLGDENYFHAMFGEMKGYLQVQGIKTVLLACPNCDKVFKTYAAEFNIQTVYEILANMEALSSQKSGGTTVALHDPCTARFNSPAQNSVRDLLKNRGITIADQLHSREKTFCCGEGGAVNCFKQERANTWSKKRLAESANHPLISYCVGCTQIFGKHTKTNHILDLLFNESERKSPVASAPLTYFKRLKLKKDLQQNFPAAATRERTFQPRQDRKINKVLISFLLAALLIIIPSVLFSL